MVEALKKSMISVTGQVALMVLSLLTASEGDAAQLLDPTRPPDFFGQAQPSTVSAGPVLQSVLISPQRKIAIISGKTVQVGEKFGESSVLSITETEVVLRNGKSLQTLKLFPDVQKKLSSSSTSAQTDHRR